MPLILCRTVLLSFMKSLAIGKSLAGTYEVSQGSRKVGRLHGRRSVRSARKRKPSRRVSVSR